MVLLVREDGVVGNGLVHGAREEHRRRVRLRLDLLPRRSSPLARHVDGVRHMDIRRPRRGARDGCVDRGGRVEEVLMLGVRALRRLLRIGLRLIRRGGLGRRRLLVRLVCVRRGEGRAASEAGLRETQAMRVGRGAQASHDELAMASSKRRGETMARRVAKTQSHQPAAAGRESSSAARRGFRIGRSRQSASNAGSERGRFFQSRTRFARPAKSRNLVPRLFQRRANPESWFGGVVNGAGRGVQSVEVRAG